MLTCMMFGTLDTLWEDVRDLNHVEFDDVMCAVLGSITMLMMCPITALLDLLCSPLEIITYFVYRHYKRKSDKYYGRNN